MKLFSADVVVADYAPTATLAAYLIGIPTVTVGTGFELPPTSSPLVPFPGFSGATQEKAQQADERVLSNVNRVGRALQRPAIESLSEVLRGNLRFLTTFPELDHYGVRSGERYIGPINEPALGHQELEWPSESQYRIFAYLRPNMPLLDQLMDALARSGAHVICFAPGLVPDRIPLSQDSRFRVVSRPVNIRPLLPSMDICISYSPAGTVTTTLLSGVPQLLSPAHVEAQMTAHRVELLGAGLIIREAAANVNVATLLERVANSGEFAERADAFARRYEAFDPAHAADEVARAIESAAA
jgi:UDP:flavonoid glycosyltransferase YjiC (YdhE family)